MIKHVFLLIFILLFSTSSFSGEIKEKNNWYGLKYTIDGKDYWLPSIISELDTKSDSKNKISGFYLNSFSGLYLTGLGWMVATVVPIGIDSPSNYSTKKKITISATGFLIMGVGVYLGLRAKRKLDSAINVYNRDEETKITIKSSNLRFMLSNEKVGVKWVFK